MQRGILGNIQESIWHHNHYTTTPNSRPMCVGNSHVCRPKVGRENLSQTMCRQCEYTPCDHRSGTKSWSGKLVSNYVWQCEYTPCDHRSGMPDCLVSNCRSAIHVCPSNGWSGNNADQHLVGPSSRAAPSARFFFVQIEPRGTKRAKILGQIDGASARSRFCFLFLRDNEKKK